MLILSQHSLRREKPLKGGREPLSQSPDLDPRELMKKDLPNWIQPFLTELTAKPFVGEQQRKRTALNHIVTTFVALGIGVATSVLALSQSGFNLGLIPIGWGLTVYGARKLRLTIMHACSHHAVFTNNRKFNCWLGEFISILTLTLNFKAYQRGHNKDHHSNKLLTPGDETYQYLIDTVGFRLGMNVNHAWKHLWKTLVSPTFHIHQFASRLAATFLSDSLSHNLLSVVFWSSVLGFVTLKNSWLAFLVAWIIPISIFFEASSLLRQCVEHHFPVPTTAKHSPEVLSQMTAAIFCGEPTPKLDSSAEWVEIFLAWTLWWLQMLFYHLPSRVFILTGDSPCHDFHHRNPGSHKWLDCIFERQKEVEAGVKYYHHWGLLEAINESFKFMSLQPPHSS
ncbi:MAG: hypothetical protein V7L21_11115 [Nostoc sp.]|uniref:hypothetical protein n=1 Tax=Nostoc sp. TaxID=1180 RepID=UPI002FFAB429